MPNGRIAIVLSVKTKSVIDDNKEREAEEYTEIYEITKKDFKIELRQSSRKHFFFEGAITTGMDGFLYMSGS